MIDKNKGKKITPYRHTVPHTYLMGRVQSGDGSILLAKVVLVLRKRPSGPRHDALAPGIRAERPTHNRVSANVNA